MKIFNTLTRTKQEFKPLNGNVVNMYVCGPTVYDLFHIGNARTFVFFDVVRRYLEYKGYDVKFVQNFTDIDDKIINKALSENKSITDISEKYIEEYYLDADNLNIKRATENPKATKNIKEMIDVISGLIEKGYAYEVDGSVYFSVRKFKEYGKLFGQDIDTLKSGSRIKVDDNKNDALDFNLWKKSKPGEPGYDSPWGMGRPGWHTECCSMIHKYFNGETIDIHGGGIDLVFPHHDNEIAQIESLYDKNLSNFWMHCSFLNINEEKMSKSLGNFLTTRDILKKYSVNAFRFFILSSHYRNIVSFSDDQLVIAQKSLSRIHKTYNSLIELLNSGDAQNRVDDNELDVSSYTKRFIEKMDDDFNTADGISIIFELIRFINRDINNLNISQIKESIKLIEDFFNIFGLELDVNTNETELDDEIIQMIDKRREFKLNKDFKNADLVREDLFNMGYIVEDIKNGVRVVNKDTNELVRVISYE